MENKPNQNKYISIVRKESTRRPIPAPIKHKADCERILPKQISVRLVWPRFSTVCFQIRPHNTKLSEDWRNGWIVPVKTIKNMYCFWNSLRAGCVKKGWGVSYPT